MSGTNGFTLVKYKHPKPNKVKKKPNSQAKDVLYHSPLQTTSDDQQLNVIYIKYIERCKLELKASPFYTELVSVISNIFSRDVPNSEKGDGKKFQDFVCYGIGKISESPMARYQFALLLLLWEHYQPSGKNYIYDPIFGSIDRKIIEHFELSLIPQNEEAKRKVCCKTLFFVPHGSKPIYNNILWANWGPCLADVVFFGNSFESYRERIPSRHLKLQASYIAEILPLTHEVKLPTSFCHDDIFNDTSLHYFLDHELSQLPSSFWHDCREPCYEDNNAEIILNTP